MTVLGLLRLLLVPPRPHTGTPGDAPALTDWLGLVQGGAEGGGPRFAGLADITLIYSVIKSASTPMDQSTQKTSSPATTKLSVRKWHGAKIVTFRCINARAHGTSKRAQEHAGRQATWQFTIRCTIRASPHRPQANVSRLEMPLSTHKALASCNRNA